MHAFTTHGGNETMKPYPTRNDQKRPGLRLTAALVMILLALGPALVYAVPVVTEGPWGAWVTSRATFDPVSASSVPRIAVDASGVPHIVAGTYATYTVPTHANYLTRGPTGWTSELIAYNTSEGPLAFDSQGVPHAALQNIWPRSDGGLHIAISYATREAPGSWKVEMVEDWTQSFYYDMKLDKQDRPHIIYDVYTPGGGEVHYATRASPNSSWVITSLPLDALGIRMALDSAGRAHFITDAQQGLVYASEQPNGSFTVEKIRSGCGDVGLALDSHDQPHAVCGGIRYFTRNPDASWNEQDITSNNDGQPFIAIDSQDRIHIAWDHGGSDSTIEYAMLTSLGWQIEDPYQVSDGTRRPDIAFDANGHPFVLFVMTDTVTNPFNIGAYGVPWLTEPLVGASPDAHTAEAQTYLQAAGLP